MALTTKEWTLGEAPPSGYRLIRETFPLPPKRELVIAQIQDILTKGLVQKLVIQTKAPIEVLRLAKIDDVDPSMDEVELGDIYGAIRNSQMIEFPPRGVPPAQTLFFAFRMLEKKNAMAHSFLVSNTPRLRKWLGLGDDDDLESVFGVQVLEHEEIPEEVLLLVASLKDDPETVSLSLRIEMDLPSEKKTKAV